MFWDEGIGLGSPDPAPLYRRTPQPPTCAVWDTSRSRIPKCPPEMDSSKNGLLQRWTPLENLLEASLRWPKAAAQLRWLESLLPKAFHTVYMLRISVYSQL